MTAFSTRQEPPGQQPQPPPARRTSGRRTLVWMLVSLLVAVLAVLLAVGWVGSERALYPPRAQQTATPAGFGLAAEEVRFLSRDGTRLAGWFIKGSRPEAVVLAHGFRSSKRGMLEQAAMLHGAGFNLLLVDLRNSGDSGGNITTFGYFERYDVAAAAEYLQRRPEVDPRRIAALGTSMGAAAALLGAAETDAIQAVVADHGYKSIESVVEVGFEHFLNLPAFPFAPITVAISEWRAGIQASQIRPIEAAPRLSPRPILFIAVLGATEIRAQDSIEMFEAASDPRQLWLVPGTGHGGAHELASVQYQRIVTGFLDAALNGRPLPTLAGTELARR